MSDPASFIKSIISPAQNVQRHIGMFTSVTIAQACLETGYNSSTPKDIHTKEESYNLFGMKAASGQPYVTSETTEIYQNLPSSYIKYEKRSDGKYKVWVHAKFRKFSSFDECFLVRADFLKKSKYWEKALNAKTPEEAIHGLQHTGYFTNGYEISYATDNEYEDKLISIISRYGLKQYDLSDDDVYIEEELKMIAELTKRVEELEKRCEDLSNKIESRDQKLAQWAKAGLAFVTTEKGDTYISDGHRPKDNVKREEIWTMLERYHRLYGTK